MAVQRQIAREALLQRKHATNVEQRSKRRDVLKSQTADAADKYEAMLSQQKKLDSSACRQTNRCERCGRARGVMRYFKLCRICFRYAVGNGLLPGVVKDSW